MNPEARTLSREALLQEIEGLRHRLSESEDTLRANRSGEVDAVVASGPGGDQVYTLKGADEAYRVMVEGMAQGAITLAKDGLILFANEQFASIVQRPLDRVVGAHLQDFITPEDADLFAAVLEGKVERTELQLASQDRGRIPVYLAVKSLILSDVERLCGIVTDLSEQRRNDLAQAAEKRAQSILEQVQAILISTDLEGRIKRWNRGATRLFGYKAREAMGQSISLICFPEGPDPIELWNGARRVRRGSETELRVRTKSGQERFIRVSLSVLKDDLGQPYGIIALAVDITAQKHQEEALAESEERYRALIDAMPQVVYVTDSSGNTKLINGRLEEYAGVTAEQCLDLDWLSFVHPDDVPGHLAQWKRCTESREDFEREYRLRNKDGEYRWHLARAIAVRKQDGSIANWVGTSTDIHELKINEDLLREKEEFLRSVFESSPDCLKILDAEGRLLDMNGPGLCQMEIDNFDGFRGRKWADLWGEEAYKVQRALEQAKAGDLAHFQAPCATAKGKVLQWDVMVIAVHDSAERVQRFVSTSRDITEEKKKEAALLASERELAQRAADLTRANEDLLHFAYAVSHDLQAPLRTVNSFAQLLDLKFKPALEGEGSKLVAGIVSASSRMGTMIRDLLQFATVAGSERGANAEAPLEESLETALAAIGGSIAESGAKITHDPLPVAHGDGGQFARLFQNLIGNSIKYRKSNTPPAVHISCRRDVEAWIVTVQDNGIGFNPEHAERIFGVFQRLHSTEFAGTGIGLTICKRIVERHGGRIWAESTEGEGARFSFSLPVERSGASMRSGADGSQSSIKTPELSQEKVEQAGVEELFQTLNLAQALIRDMEGKILVWTRGAERLFGFSQAEALGRNAADLLRKQFPKPWPEIEVELLRSGEWEGEVQAKKETAQPSGWQAIYLCIGTAAGVHNRWWNPTLASTN